MRLVEICVDGGLEATMYSAAVAAGGRVHRRRRRDRGLGSSPRTWWRASLGRTANIERFRRALELSGEPDPDALIASRLSGESPFTSTDLLLAGDSQLFEPPVEAKTE